MSIIISKDRSKVGRLLSREMATEYALAGLGAIIYTGLPTGLNLQGGGAMALGLGTCLALGIWWESPALLAGGLFVALVHVIYKWGSNWTMQTLGRPIWSLDPATPSVPGGMYDYIRANAYSDGYGMHDGYGMQDQVQMPNGYTALALPPADPPAPQQMNDYIRSQEQLMDDDGYLSSVRYEQNGSFEAPSMFD